MLQQHPEYLGGMMASHLSVHKLMSVTDQHPGCRLMGAGRWLRRCLACLCSQSCTSLATYWEMQEWRHWQEQQQSTCLRCVCWACRCEERLVPCYLLGEGCLADGLLALMWRRPHMDCNGSYPYVRMQLSCTMSMAGRLPPCTPEVHFICDAQENYNVGAEGARALGQLLAASSSLQVGGRRLGGAALCRAISL